MQALPLFLDRLADPITAVVLSVTVVLIFGEALCSLRMLSPAHKYWHMSSCKIDCMTMRQQCTWDLVLQVLWALQPMSYTDHILTIILTVFQLLVHPGCFM